MNSLSIVVLLAVSLPLAYLYLLALAALRVRPTQPSQQPHHRFAIAIPAHNEEAVIGHTVATLRQLDYPPHLFDVHVVADHCDDRTAQVAQAVGAIVHERHEEPRGSKGAALRWLFQRVLSPQSEVPSPNPYDAVVVFDADTRVDPQFLRVMDARLTQGDQVIQGQHRISNPDDGWFPALTWAMFLVDNRYQNLGRSNLGWAAKNMGDSICFKADVLRRSGWGEGLTEDYQLRQKLLLAGITISFEPNAKGYGESPRTWSQAKAQRARWLRGTVDASQKFAWQLLTNAFQQRNLAMLDGALQAYFPSYSTLSIISISLLCLQYFTNIIIKPIFPSWLIGGWAVSSLVLFLYPFPALVLERAPLKAYLAILTGPFFILWRTWLALNVRFSKRQITWIRTAHGKQQ